MPPNEFSTLHPHEIDDGIPAKLDDDGRCLVCRIMVARDNAYRERDAAIAERDMLQIAVDHAHGALSSSQYVGGLTEREAWQRAMEESLGAVVTQHVGQDAPSSHEAGHSSDE